MVWDYGQVIARFCRGQQARGWWSWGRALRDGNCKNAAEESLKYVDRLRHCCKKTLSKIWRGTGWWASKLWTTFLWIFWDESLKSVKYRKELFLNGTVSKTQFSTISIRKKYLLISWVGGPDGKYLSRRHDGPSATTSVRHDRVPNFFPSGSNKLNQNEFHYIWPLSVENSKIFLNLNRTR